jgi:hypothetical protein
VPPEVRGKKTVHMERIIEAAKAKVKETECSLGDVNAETSRKFTALKDVLVSIEQTEDLIKVNNQECEGKIHAKPKHQKEVCMLLQHQQVAE